MRRLASTLAVALLLCGCSISEEGVASTSGELTQFAPDGWEASGDVGSSQLSDYCSSPACVATSQSWSTGGAVSADDVTKMLEAQPGWTVVYEPACEERDGVLTDRNVDGYRYSEPALGRCTWEAQVGEGHAALVWTQGADLGSVRVSMRLRDWSSRWHDSPLLAQQKRDAAAPLVDLLDRVAVDGDDVQGGRTVRADPSTCVEVGCITVSREWRRVQGFDPRVDIAKLLVDAGFKVVPYVVDDACHTLPGSGNYVCTVHAQTGTNALWVRATGTADTDTTVTVFAASEAPDSDR